MRAARSRCVALATAVQSLVLASCASCASCASAPPPPTAQTADAGLLAAMRAAVPLNPIGVVLSGYQDCGTAGMMSIKARGGLGVVQSPETAAAADMPRSVIDRVSVDFVVPPPELPGLLSRLASTSAGRFSWHRRQPLKKPVFQSSIKWHSNIN